jgi:DNA-binding response OmpR family regulator
LPEQIAEFMDAGINDYLTKPFDARVLLDKIDQRAAAPAPGVPPAPEMPDAAMAADMQFYAKMVDDLYDLLGADRAAAHIDGFMVESGNKLAALAAITEPPQAYPLLHTLSSSAGSIGLNGTMKEVRRLMDDLDDLDTPAYAARLQRLRTIFAAEKTVLRDYRARRAAPPARAAESWSPPPHYVIAC